MHNHNRSITIVAQQLPLCLPLPHVNGPVEFTAHCALLNRIDSLLQAGLENDFVLLCLQHKQRRRPMKITEQENYQQVSRQALHCNIFRHLFQESYRVFSCHLAESMILQHFCRIGDFEEATIPGRSQLQRYEHWLPEAQLRGLISSLILLAQAEDAPQKLGLQKPIDMNTA